jgi:hypothetical protein
MKVLVRVVPLAAAALLALAGCSDSSSSGSGPTGGDVGAAGEKVTDGAGKKIDACSLLQAGEVQALVPGAPVEGEEQGTGYCTWEDPTTFNSVSVRIGSPDTAAGGELPAPEGVGAGYEDGPDGIRFSMGGTVAEFLADGRACDVQIVNGKEAKSDLIALVGKLQSRVGK